MIQAGKKIHKVILQSPAGSRDAVGERVTTWTNVATVWASIEPLSVRDAFLAAQAHASTTHRVRIDWSTDVDNIDGSWRVLFGSRVLVGAGTQCRGSAGVCDVAESCTRTASPTVLSRNASDCRTSASSSIRRRFSVPRRSSSIRSRRSRPVPLGRSAPRPIVG